VHPKARHHRFRGRPLLQRPQGRFECRVEETTGTHAKVAPKGRRAGILGQLAGAFRKVRAGEDFADIARSLPFPGADRGGDLGYFSEANMIPPIVAVARQLEVGQVSPPFPTAYGWHLVTLEDIRSMAVPPFDQLRESIYRNLREEAAQAVLTQLRSAHPVERFARDGSPLDPANQAQ